MPVSIRNYFNYSRIDCVLFKHSKRDPKYLTDIGRIPVLFEKVPDQVTRQVAVRVCKGDKEDVEGDFEIVSSSPISGVRNGVEVDESAGNDDNNNNDDPEKIVFG